MPTPSPCLNIIDNPVLVTLAHHLEPPLLCNINAPVPGESVTECQAGKLGLVGELGEVGGDGAQRVPVPRHQSPRSECCTLKY